MKDESEQPQVRNPSAAESLDGGDGENDASVLFNTKPVGLGRAAETVDNDEHRRFVRYDLRFLLVNYLLSCS